MIPISLYTLHYHKRRVAAGYVYLESDIEWNVRSIVLNAGGCVVAGIAAGLLGIGGGMLKIPIMLYMGMNPAVCGLSICPHVIDVILYCDFIICSIYVDVL